MYYYYIKKWIHKTEFIYCMYYTLLFTDKIKGLIDYNWYQPNKQFSWICTLNNNVL